MKDAIVRGRRRHGPHPPRGEGRRAPRLKAGERCDCGGLVRFELRSRQHPPRRACASCAERAPFTTLVRPL